MEKISSLEISFIPIQSDDFIKDVDAVLEIIKKSGFDYKIGLMSTEITGDYRRLFELMKRIYEAMNDKCKFEIVAKISNICGCWSQK